jgi:hypothetical protein
MVHHVQNVAGLKFECSQARERPAYVAQDRWLALFGSNLVDEFELNPITVLVRTRCMHRERNGAPQNAPLLQDTLPRDLVD